MSNTVIVPCWRVYVWRGHWQVRSSHDTAGAARLALLVAQRRDRFDRFRIVEATRRVATFVQPPAPTEAQRFRERQADQMVIRRQAHTYYKSGCNGTEILQPPAEAPPTPPQPRPGKTA